MDPSPATQPPRVLNHAGGIKGRDRTAIKAFPYTLFVLLFTLRRRESVLRHSNAVFQDVNKVFCESDEQHEAEVMDSTDLRPPGPNGRAL